MSIGKDLKAVRKRLGLSPDRLGALVGVSGMTIRNYEAGRSKPSPLAQERLLTFIGGLGNGETAEGSNV